MSVREKAYDTLNHVQQLPNDQPSCLTSTERALQPDFEDTSTQQECQESCCKCAQVIGTLQSKGITLISMAQLIIVVIVLAHGLQNNAIHPHHIGVPHAAQQGGLLDQLRNGCLSPSIAPLLQGTTNLTLGTGYDYGKAAL